MKKSNFKSTGNSTKSAFSNSNCNLKSNGSLFNKSNSSGTFSSFSTGSSYSGFNKSAPSSAQFKRSTSDSVSSNFSRDKKLTLDKSCKTSQSKKEQSLTSFPKYSIEKDKLTSSKPKYEKSVSVGSKSSTNNTNNIWSTSNKFVSSGHCHPADTSKPKFEKSMSVGSKSNKIISPVLNFPSETIWASNKPKCEKRVEGLKLTGNSFATANKFVSSGPNFTSPCLPLNKSNCEKSSSATTSGTFEWGNKKEQPNKNKSISNEVSATPFIWSEKNANNLVSSSSTRKSTISDQNLGSSPFQSTLANCSNKYNSQLSQNDQILKNNPENLSYFPKSSKGKISQNSQTSHHFYDNFSFSKIFPIKGNSHKKHQEIRANGLNSNVPFAMEAKESYHNGSLSPNAYAPNPKTLAFPEQTSRTKDVIMINKSKPVTESSSVFDQNFSKANKLVYPQTLFSDAATKNDSKVSHSSSLSKSFLGLLFAKHSDDKKTKNSCDNFSRTHSQTEGSNLKTRDLKGTFVSLDNKYNKDHKSILLNGHTSDVNELPNSNCSNYVNQSSYSTQIPKPQNSNNSIEGSLAITNKTSMAAANSISTTPLKKIVRMELPNQVSGNFVNDSEHSKVTQEPSNINHTGNIKKSSCVNKDSSYHKSQANNNSKIIAELLKSYLPHTEGDNGSVEVCVKNGSIQVSKSKPAGKTKEGTNGVSFMKQLQDLTVSNSKQNFANGHSLVPPYNYDNDVNAVPNHNLPHSKLEGISSSCKLSSSKPDSKNTSSELFTSASNINGVSLKKNATSEVGNKVPVITTTIVSPSQISPPDPNKSTAFGQEATVKMPGSSFVQSNGVRPKVISSSGHSNLPAESIVNGTNSSNSQFTSFCSNDSGDTKPNSLSCSRQNNLLASFGNLSQVISTGPLKKSSKSSHNTAPNRGSAPSRNNSEFPLSGLSHGGIIPSRESFNGVESSHDAGFTSSVSAPNMQQVKKLKKCSKQKHNSNAEIDPHHSTPFKINSGGHPVPISTYARDAILTALMFSGVNSKRKKRCARQNEGCCRSEPPRQINRHNPSIGLSALGLALPLSARPPASLGTRHEDCGQEAHEEYRQEAHKECRQEAHEECRQEALEQYSQEAHEQYSQETHERLLPQTPTFTIITSPSDPQMYQEHYFKDLVIKPQVVDEFRNSYEKTTQVINHGKELLASGNYVQACVEFQIGLKLMDCILDASIDCTDMSQLDKTICKSIQEVIRVDRKSALEGFSDAQAGNTTPSGNLQPSLPEGAPTAPPSYTDVLREDLEKNLFSGSSMFYEENLNQVPRSFAVAMATESGPSIELTSLPPRYESLNSATHKSNDADGHHLLLEQVNLLAPEPTAPQLSSASSLASLAPESLEVAQNLVHLEPMTTEALSPPLVTVPVLPVIVSNENNLSKLAPSLILSVEEAKTSSPDNIDGPSSNNSKSVECSSSKTCIESNDLLLKNNKIANGEVTENESANKPIISEVDLVTTINEVKIVIDESCSESMQNMTKNAAINNQDQSTTANVEQINNSKDASKGNAQITTHNRNTNCDVPSVTTMNEKISNAHAIDKQEALYTSRCDEVDDISHQSKSVKTSILNFNRLNFNESLKKGSCPTSSEQINPCLLGPAKQPPPPLPSFSLGNYPTPSVKAHNSLEFPPDVEVSLGNNSDANSNSKFQNLETKSCMTNGRMHDNMNNESIYICLKDCHTPDAKSNVFCFKKIGINESRNVGEVGNGRQSPNSKGLRKSFYNESQAQFPSSDYDYSNDRTSTQFYHQSEQISSPVVLDPFLFEDPFPEGQIDRNLNEDHFGTGDEDCSKSFYQGPKIISNSFLDSQCFDDAVFLVSEQELVKPQSCSSQYITSDKNIIPFSHNEPVYENAVKGKQIESDSRPNQSIAFQTAHPSQLHSNSAHLYTHLTAERIICQKEEELAESIYANFPASLNVSSIRRHSYCAPQQFEINNGFAAAKATTNNEIEKDNYYGNKVKCKDEFDSEQRTQTVSTENILNDQQLTLNVDPKIQNRQTSYEDFDVREAFVSSSKNELSVISGPMRPTVTEGPKALNIPEKSFKSVNSKIESGFMKGLKNLSISSYNLYRGYRNATEEGRLIGQSSFFVDFEVEDSADPEESRWTTQIWIENVKVFFITKNDSITSPTANQFILIKEEKEKSIDRHSVPLIEIGRKLWSTHLNVASTKILKTINGTYIFEDKSGSYVAVQLSSKTKLSTREQFENILKKNSFYQGEIMAKSQSVREHGKVIKKMECFIKDKTPAFYFQAQEFSRKSMRAVHSATSVMSKGIMNSVHAISGSPASLSPLTKKIYGQMEILQIQGRILEEAQLNKTIVYV